MSKKIYVNLSTQSIESAKKSLESLKKEILNNFTNNFLSRCCEEIIAIANRNLDMTDIGYNIKEAIKSNWKYSVKKGKAMISNFTGNQNENKAVFVEFGVGIIGEKSSHPNAGQVGYKYNVDSEAKKENRSWSFRKDSTENVDLGENYYSYIDYGTGIEISSKGQPAQMYVFNAICEFKDNDMAKEIWKQVKQEILGA